MLTDAGRSVIAIGRYGAARGIAEPEGGWCRWLLHDHSPDTARRCGGHQHV